MRGKKWLMGLGALVVCASMLFALFMGLRMEIVIALARMQLGKPYVFGAAGPDAGEIAHDHVNGLLHLCIEFLVDFLHITVPP